MSTNNNRLSYAAASKPPAKAATTQGTPAGPTEVTFGTAAPVQANFKPPKNAWQATPKAPNTESTAPVDKRNSQKPPRAEKVQFGNAGPVDLARTASAPPLVQGEDNQPPTIPKKSPLNAQNGPNYARSSPGSQFARSPQVDPNAPYMPMPGYPPYFQHAYQFPHGYPPVVPIPAKPVQAKDGNAPKVAQPPFPYGAYPAYPPDYSNYYGSQFYPPNYKIPPVMPAPGTGAAPVPAFSPAKSKKIVIINPLTSEEVRLPVPPKSEETKKTESTSPVVIVNTPEKSKGIVLKNPTTGEIVTPFAANVKITKPDSVASVAAETVKKEDIAEPAKETVLEEPVNDTVDTEPVKVEVVQRPPSPVKVKKEEIVGAKSPSPLKALPPKVEEKVTPKETVLPETESPLSTAASAAYLEDGEVEDPTIRADARILESHEFSLVNYPEGIPPPVVVDGVIKYSSALFNAIRNLITAKPVGIPTFKYIYGESDNRHANRGVSMARQNSSHDGRSMRGRGGRRGNLDRVPMTRQGSRGTLPARRNRGPPAAPAAPALVKSENAWDVKKLDLSEDEKVLKTSKGILNKLSLDNFERLSDKILELELTNENILQGLMEQICLKAIDELKFCAMYARLCQKLIMKLPTVQPWVTPTPDNIKTNLFRQLLLKRCQAEFEKDSTWAADDAIAQVRRRELRENIDKLSAEEKAQFAEEDYQRKLIKNRSLGNIRFVGELFLQGIIAQKIIHNCIVQLLSPPEPEEEEIESLCNLMTSIGKTIDVPQNRDLIASYFNKIRELSTAEFLPSRIRFMLLDLIDLRQDKWATKNSVAAKSLAEVQQEIENEERKRLALQKSSSGRGGPRDRPGPAFRRNDSRDFKPQPKPQKQEDGWNTVAKDASSVRSQWGATARARPTSASTQEERPAIKANNIFAALQSENNSSESIVVPDEVDEVQEDVPEPKAQIDILNDALANFRESLSIAELLDDLGTVDEVPVLQKLVSGLLQFQIDTNGKNTLRLSEIFKRLFFESAAQYDTQILIDGFKEFLEGLQDDIFDYPNAFGNMAEILLPALEAGFITFDQIFEISEPVSKFAGRVPMRPKFFVDMLKKLDGPSAILQFLIVNEVDVKAFFPDGTTDVAIAKWIQMNSVLKPIGLMNSIVMDVFRIAGKEADWSNSYRWFNSQTDGDILSKDQFGVQVATAIVNRLVQDNIITGTAEGPVVPTRELYIKLKEDLTVLKSCLGYLEDPLDILVATEASFREKKITDFLEDFFRIYFEIEIVREPTFAKFKEICGKETKKLLAKWYKYLEI